MFSIAKTRAPAPGKDSRHKASDFLIELPACHHTGEPAPLRSRAFLFDEKLKKLRHERPKRSERQPGGPAFDPGRVQTQIINFKTQTLPIEIALLQQGPFPRFDILYFKESSHRESFLTSERLSAKG